jgi:hypothetical protein
MSKIKIPMTREMYSCVFDLIRFRACCMECKKYAPHDDKTGRCLEMEERAIADSGVLPLSACNLWDQKERG